MKWKTFILHIHLDLLSAQVTGLYVKRIVFIPEESFAMAFSSEKQFLLLGKEWAESVQNAQFLTS